MKHVRSRDLLTTLEGLSDIFRLLAVQGAEQYLLGMLQYVLEKSDISDINRFERFLKISLSPPLEEKAMTLAQLLRKEGFEEGIHQGIQQGVQQGLQEGKRKGKLEGERELLIKLLSKRFGAIPTKFLSAIEKANAEAILKWSEQIFSAKTIEEVFDTYH